MDSAGYIYELYESKKKRLLIWGNMDGDGGRKAEKSYNYILIKSNKLIKIKINKISFN